MSEGNSRCRALDLFCGAGGVSVGLELAGFDVLGVDNVAQPEYPDRFEFVCADALAFLRFVDLSSFDLIWASPPCPAYSTATRDTSKHPRLIAPTRELLRASGIPYVIENVVGAKRELVEPVMLCGAMFDLGVVRHRFFECSFPMRQPAHVEHVGSIVTGEYVTVAGNGGVPTWTFKERARRGLPRHVPGEMRIERWREAMGIEWMSRAALVKAIPPAYAQHVGRAARAAAAWGLS